MSFRVTESPIEELYDGSCSYCKASIRTVEYSHGRSEEKTVYNCEISSKKTNLEKPCSNIDKLYCPLAGARGR